MVQILRVPFKAEYRGGCAVGYPCVFWEYQGIRYEELLDSGADNNVFPVDFLQLLENNGQIEVANIYKNGNFFDSTGVGGRVCLTNPIKIEISLHASPINRACVKRMKLSINCCIPDSISVYRDYLMQQSKIPFLLAELKATKDTRLKKRIEKQRDHYLKWKNLYNPPFLFGKPFISCFDSVTFCIKGQNAGPGSYFELNVR